MRAARVLGLRTWNGQQTVRNDARPWWGWTERPSLAPGESWRCSTWLDTVGLLASNGPFDAAWDCAASSFLHGPFAKPGAQEPSRESRELFKARSKQTPILKRQPAPSHTFPGRPLLCRGSETATSDTSGGDCHFLCVEFHASDSYLTTDNRKGYYS